MADGSWPSADAEATGAHAPGRIGVVIPVHKQGMLLIEAIESVLAQQGVAPWIVVVDDGCPQPESRALGLAYAEIFERVTYLRQSNRGLSSARNTGVEWLLRRHPDIQAIYMLDADNRLRPGALARALAALHGAPETVGWIYPDLDMFGVTAAFDYGGVYSPLAHRWVNVSEAGSLVRTSVFRAGVRFDEAMRDGYEDWDFFLSAAEAGFSGLHLPGFGLEYRKRGESMLAEASRQDAGLRSAIQKKHPAAFETRTLLSLEQEEAPRYAIYLSDEGRFLFTTDPLSGGAEIDLDEAARLYWAARSTPTRAHFPPFLVVTSRAALNALAMRRVLHWALWRLETSAGETSAFAFLSLARGELFGAETIEPDGSHRSAPLLMFGTAIATEVLKDEATAWVDSLTSETPTPRVALTRLTAPDLPRTAALPPAANLIGHLLSAFRHSPWRDGAELSVTWKAPARPARSALHTVARLRAGSAEAVVTPMVRGDQRDVGFLLPFVSFGGVEKVATETARALRAAGCVPHLFVWGGSPLQWTAGAVEPFETVHVIDDPHGRGWDERQGYLGTALPSAAADPASHPALLGALGWLRAVINCHSVGGHAIMAQLRARGVRTFVHTHVQDQTPLGRPVGHPALALAYEHAYDGVIACSDELGDWLSAMGVPSSKLIRAPNAPGYPLAEAEVERRLAERRARLNEEPLRVLFLGRLDRQKGLDRLETAIGSAGGCQWRVAGRSVLGDGREAARLRALGVLVEPPAESSEALTELYAWADVLVLLSHWEGLPLTVLEAQRLGCVPVVTDVGAVREAVTDGVDGVLVASDRRTGEAAATALMRLAEDRDLLDRLSSAAAERGRGRTWTKSLEGLLAALA